MALGRQHVLTLAHDCRTFDLDVSGHHSIFLTLQLPRTQYGKACGTRLSLPSVRPSHINTVHSLGDTHTRSLGRNPRLSFALLDHTVQNPSFWSHLMDPLSDKSYGYSVYSSLMYHTSSIVHKPNHHKAKEARADRLRRARNDPKVFVHGWRSVGHCICKPQKFNSQSAERKPSWQCEWALATKIAILILTQTSIFSVTYVLLPHVYSNSLTYLFPTFERHLFYQ